MSRKLQLLFILFLVSALSSAASHATVHWLKIKVTGSELLQYGPKDLKPLIVLHGSSPAYDGIDWEEISTVAGGTIETWATAGSSPEEWEIMHERSPTETSAFVVVTPADLDEYYLGDFRADIVPLGQTISRLWQCNCDLQFYKRILNQYVVMVVRKLFPTVGRSDGVMVGIRAKLLTLVRGSTGSSESDAATFGARGKSQVTEEVSSWSEAHIQRRLVLARASCMGKHAFNRLKKLALVHLLQRAGKQGQVLLVVLPVSPIYQQSFFSPAVMRDFELELTDVQGLCPDTQVIRLDDLPDLNTNDYFSDFVHLNMYGQQAATKNLLTRLEGIRMSR